MDTLAIILSDAGRTEQALELEKKAVAISPDYHIARLNLARIYIKTGDKVRAKAELEQLAKLGNRFGDQAEVARLLQTL
jgi:predicted Zn-dependent protease